jgi:hypothetical protein
MVCRVSLKKQPSRLYLASAYPHQSALPLSLTAFSFCSTLSLLSTETAWSYWPSGKKDILCNTNGFRKGSEKKREQSTYHAHSLSN